MNVSLSSFIVVPEEHVEFIEYLLDNPDLITKFKSNHFVMETFKQPVDSIPEKIETPDDFVGRNREGSYGKGDSQIITDGHKSCSKCGEIQPLSNYRKQKASTSGYKSQCKPCLKKYDVKYVDNEVNKAKAAKWRTEKRAQLRAYNKEFNRIPKNKALFSFKQKVNSHLRYQLYNNKEFARHIHSLFSAGMTFDNHGEWELDHIIPVTKFISMGITDYAAINEMGNIQPLWKSDNMKKSNKIDDSWES